MSTFEEKLIELIKKKVYLYLKTDKNYKNNFIKENIWAGISGQLGVTVEKAKGRWKTLRNTYRNKVAKRNMPSGSEAERETTWKFFKAMNFLQDQMVQTPTLENYDLTEEIEIQVPEMDENPALTSPNDFPDLESSLLSPASTATLPNKRTKFDLEGLKKSYEKFLQDATKSLEQCKEDKDDISLFMESIALKIEKENLTQDEQDES